MGKQVSRKASSSDDGTEVDTQTEAEFKERSTVLELGRERQDGHSDSLLGLKPLDLDIDDG